MIDLTARQLSLLDKTFAHDRGSVAGVVPHLIAWDRSLQREDQDLFVTDVSIPSFEPGSISAPRTFAWLIESQGVIPDTYEKVAAVAGSFDLVFTHSSHLLKELTNARFSPGGGVWIGGDYAGGEMGLHPKSKWCSMLTTTKKQTRMHRFRLLTALRLRAARRVNVDVWINPAWVASYEVLRDYRFNICIENYIDEEYFTERILNCFATGTVPIYRGASRIDRHFNVDGIIQFSTWGELRSILQSLTEDSYTSRMDAIEDNLQRVRRFRCIEDYIAENYLLGG